MVKTEGPWELFCFTEILYCSLFSAKNMHLHPLVKKAIPLQQRWCLFIHVNAKIQRTMLDLILVSFIMWSCAVWHHVYVYMFKKYHVCIYFIIKKSSCLVLFTKNTKTNGSLHCFGGTESCIIWQKVRVQKDWNNFKLFIKTL